MKVRKEVWYVIAIVVIIVLIMVVFRDEIGFSPRQKTASSSTSGVESYLNGLGGSKVSASIFQDEIEKLKPAARLDDFLLVNKEQKVFCHRESESTVCERLSGDGKYIIAETFDVRRGYSTTARQIGEEIA